MHTLVFLSTRQVLQCQPAACQALPLLPRELFPLLFKVAFMDKKTVVLQELVHTWPFPLLSFQQLLQECVHCSRALLQERLSTESMQAVILGLTARLHTPEKEAGTQPLCRYAFIRGAHGLGVQRGFTELAPGCGPEVRKSVGWELSYRLLLYKVAGRDVGLAPSFPASGRPCSQEACIAGTGHDWSSG